MKLKLLLASVMVVLVAIFATAFLPQSHDATAATSQTCDVSFASKNGNEITITACNQTFSFNLNEAANGTLGSINLPVVPPVTLPPLPAVTIKVPGPTIQIPGPTVQVPGATATVKVPSDTKTVKVPAPQATKTIFQKPIREPLIINRTVTASPRPQAVRTERSTVTASPTPAVTKTVRGNDDVIDFFDGNVTEKEVIVGTISTALLMMLVLLALYAGYVLGYRDKQRDDTNFMRALLDAAAIRRR